MYNKIDFFIDTKVNFCFLRQIQNKTLLKVNKYITFFEKFFRKQTNNDKKKEFI